MDLFEQSAHSNKAHQPLAERLRPSSLQEIIGLDKIKGCSKSFLRLLNEGHLQSLILWGPPGTGKTTFAEVITRQTGAEKVSLNAVAAGVKTVREIGEQAKRRRIEMGQKTLVFIDEIHRFSKSQQDVLLPYIEKGDFYLVGATTENPSYELNSALLSRCRLLVLSRHDEEDLQIILERACKEIDVNWEELLVKESREFLFRLADGDARRLINLLEPILTLYSLKTSEEVWPVSSDRLEDLCGQKAMYFDKKGDEHYDVVSAFIKSLRGSDPDASLYYLARMLEGGEDPVFIARRLVILASEDISNADPRALSLAVAGLQAVELIGLPECAINLSQVVTYLACAPKSNRSYVALRKSQEEVKKTGQLPVPLALRSGKGKVLKELGYGKGYKYSHDGEKGYVEQSFFPEDVKEKKYYEPSDRGFEKNIQQYQAWVKNRKREDVE